jgi:hypothetical protein
VPSAPVRTDGPPGAAGVANAALFLLSDEASFITGAACRWMAGRRREARLDGASVVVVQLRIPIDAASFRRAVQHHP